MSWVLVDKPAPNDNKVLVYQKSQSLNGFEKKIYKSKQVEFSLIYNQQGKMLGYQLKYGYAKKFDKFVLFNSFMIFYNPSKIINPEDEKFDTIYEDQVIRLSAFVHKSGAKDYLLVGRWRNETELVNA